MVLAAMANPPEHDFAPSWLKIPSDQQKRGQKLGAPSSTSSSSIDQWSSGSKSSHQDDGGHNKSRHRHYSSSDSPALSSSHQSGGGYGGRPSSGTPSGGYGYRGRETDRRNYPRPGSGSRHHSVDDLNGFPNYGGGGGWSLPQYNGGFYSNYPRHGSSSVGGFSGNPRYGEVFHAGGGGVGGGGGGRGYYNTGSRGGGSAGRQRYNSGSRASYNERDNHPDGNTSSHSGDSSDVSAKKKDGTDHESKKSALSRNDFPSLIGDNSKTSGKDAAKKSGTPSGVWDKPPGGPKVQISGRKVQLIKKSIHNDLPPRDPSSSSTKSKSNSSSGTNPEGSKVTSVGQLGSGTRGSRSTSSASTAPASTAPGSSSSSINGGYKPSTTSSVSQKASVPVKVPDSSSISSNQISPRPSSKDSNLAHSPQSTYSNPPKSASGSPPKPHHTTTTQQTKPYEKKAIDINRPDTKPPTSKAGIRSAPEASTFVAAKNDINKPLEGRFTSAQKDAVTKTGPARMQTQTDAKPSVVGKEPSNKPVLVATSTNQKSGSSKPVSGKESPTKPVLVQTATSVTKSTVKPLSVKNVNGKESPIRPVPIQIKSTNTTKFSGKESSIRPFPVRTSNQKQNSNRDRSVRPGPVQIKSNRLVSKESQSVRPVPVHMMTRKSTAAKDNPNDVDAMSRRPISSSGPKEKQSSPSRVTPSLAKEPSTNPTSTSTPVDINNARFSHNKNVNNSESGNGVRKGLQNGGDHWALNGPLRIEDAEKMNGPQRTRTETDSTEHITTNGLDNDLHSGMNNLQLSSSLEAEKRLLQEMGWHEHSDNEEGYAPITEDEMKEFQRRSQQLKTQRNGITRNLPVALLSSSLPNTPMTSIDLDDALSSCSSDSSDDDL